MTKSKYILVSLLLLFFFSMTISAQDAKENKMVKEVKEMVHKHDTNKDGKVFQCQMCTENISDKKGECSCGMELKEVSVDKAAEVHLAAMHKMHNHEKMEMKTGMKHPANCTCEKCTTAKQQMKKEMKHPADCTCEKCSAAKEG